MDRRETGYPTEAREKKSPTQYTGEMFEQLSQINHARSKSEMERGVYRLLSLVGKAMRADRVFLFDCIDRAAEIYSNTFEWCADGVVPQIDNLSDLTRADMPCWLETFERGEPILIPELDDVRMSMPSEYEILRAQGIHSEIAVPVFYRGDLSGFFGLDNPGEEITENRIRLLNFIGGHLGSARENLRMLTLLEQKQQSLEQSLKAMQMEQEMLKVVCKDSASVYRIDLLNNTAEIVKLEGYTNAAARLLAHGTTMLYAEEIRRYYDNFVMKETAPDFLKLLEAKHLMQELQKKDCVSCRYQSRPNDRGQVYFEVRINKLRQTEDSFQALMDFRSVDEIVREERAHQRRLEAALAESRANYEVISAIGKIYYTIYRIDLRTQWYEEISSNPEMHRMNGSSGCASIHMAAASRKNIVPEYLPYVEPFFDLSTLPERLRTEDSIALEYPVKDGNWHLARFIVQTRDAEGTAEQVLFAMRLYSVEKRREKNLMNEAEEARRANEAKSEFLSRMSHDIRTPMNVIMGFTNIALQNTDDPAKMKECLEKIRISGGNLQELIDDVLDISRIESGEFQIISQPVKIQELYDFYCQAIAGMAAEKQIRFSGKMHHIFHNVLLSDQIRLGQIYMNLLSNAVKYTPEKGGVTFEVYEELLAGSDKIRLVSVVRDTGIGMTPEFMERMYSAFSRAVDTRVNKVRGSGLGLAIVKKIVDLMGGTIEAESEPGKGTTFRVTLDLPAAADDAVAEEHAETETILPEKALTVLVAEDNDLNYEITAEQLRGRKVRCVRAVNGQDCVQQIETAPDEFDAILMDMQMPVMNGLEATAAIRSLDSKAAKRIPIIALTANAYREDIQKCIAAGMNAHLSKPLSIDRAVQTIVECIRSAKESE